MKSKVSLGLAKLSVPAKIEKARQIVSAMTGNANFQTPSPDLGQVTSAINDLEEAHVDAADGGKSKTSFMYSREELLDNLLTQLGHYVEDASQNSEAVILSAGMSVRRTKSAPLTQMETPVNLEATTGANPGEINLSWESVERTTNYIVELNTAPGVWTFLGYTTKARYKVKALSSLARYSFRVAAIGIPGVSPYSDTASAAAI